MSYRYADTGVTIIAGKLYFDPNHYSGFSNLKLLHAVARGRTAGELRAWLEAHDAYTLHRPVRKRFNS